MINAAFKSLKVGGYICFLATPNTNSPVYKIKHQLPFIDAKYNYWVPSDIALTNVLINSGFKIEEIEYPYWNTPYRRFFHDHIYFFFNLFSSKYFSHAFWRSSINMIAKKVAED